ncbi:MAG: glycosyltransferase [Flavobacterium sp.]|nr:MAG: glycosyltransferase [Flavobacterium sp.]
MKPKISFCCISYNHEKFIQDTLDGFASQDLPYDYEIVICDDNSTDQTATIISNNRGKFKNFHFKKNDINLGPVKNFVQALEMCEGEYIALCEGDDFWTDPFKIQKQVDFLETHPEYVGVHHAVKVIRESTNQSEIWTEAKETISIFDLTLRNRIMTVSCMFRNRVEGFPTWISNLPVGDYPLNVFNAQFGLFKLLPGVMATYRVHDGGIYESKPEHRKLRMMIDTVNGMIGNFDEPINIKLAEQQVSYLNIYREKFGLEDFNYLPKAFGYLLDENKGLKHKTLVIGSIKGFLVLKWENLQRKLSLSK